MEWLKEQANKSATASATYIKSENKHEDGDEDDERNTIRGNWSSRLEFLLSCLGYAVGLGNVWRFPYLAYRNGGGAFFIPYTIMLIIVGVPIFFLELSLGQFTSNGPTTCWKFAQFFQGIGFGMVLVSAMVSIYYNMIIGWSFYYLFASFTDDLPWAECRPEWSTRLCGKAASNYTEARCLLENLDVLPDGTCRKGGEIYGLYNTSLAKENKIKLVLEAEEYLYRWVLGSAFSADIGEMGGLRWRLVLCLVLAWVVVALSLSKGIKSSGKVVYFTATFPYVVLMILLIRGVLLKGYSDGIKFYITPDLDRLSDARVWKDAATQIFFSLSASWGGLIALSSYNKFHYDVFRDTLLVTFGNCLTSVFAGFVIFSYLGFLAQNLNQDISEVAANGPGLAFIVYPMAVTKLPVSPLWSILFFVMLITLGVDSEFVLVETVTTTIMDMFPRTRFYRSFVVISICLIFFVLGLPLCYDGGYYLLGLVDYYAGGWNVLVLAIFECIAIGWVYGVRRFLRDIETMVGQKVCYCMPWNIWKYFWAACWCVLTPLALSFVLLFSWADYQRMEGYPWWADILGWLMTLVVVFAIFGVMAFWMYVTPGTFKERLRYLTTPLPEWGPALPQHRQLVTEYVPGYAVDVRPAGEPESISIHVSNPKLQKRKSSERSHH